MVLISAVVAVYQRQLSLPSLQGQLSWGVNGHTTQCTGPFICGLAT